MIGHFEADGSNAFLNGKRARDGTTVRLGDTASTGVGSSVRVNLNNGDTIELDENTDPNFFEEAGCLVVQVATGRIFVEGTDICVRTPDLASKQHSSVAYQVQPGHSEVVVLRGTLEVQRPLSLTLNMDDYVSVRNGRVESQRRLPQAQAQQFAQWRQRWFQRPSSPPSVVPPPPPPPPVVPPPRVSGYCCFTGGAVVPLTGAQCQERRGHFFTSEETAKAQCPVVIR